MPARLCIAACTMLVGCMTAAQNDESDFRARRDEMVEQQIRQRGVTNLFLAGGCVAGRATGNIFIENGRFHGEKIIGVLAERLR